MNASTMKEIGHAIAELTDRLDDLDQRIAIAFKQLKGRVNTLEARVDGRMDQLESETKRVVASFGNRVDGVATGFKQVSYGVSGMETRVAGRLDEAGNQDEPTHLRSRDQDRQDRPALRRLRGAETDTRRIFSTTRSRFGWLSELMEAVFHSFAVCARCVVSTGSGAWTNMDKPKE